MSDPFAQADSIARGVQQLVNARVADATATAASLRQEALAAVAALAAINLDLNVGSPPAPPGLGDSVDINIDLPPVTPTSFGSITARPSDDPSLLPVPGIPDINIPEFSPSIGTIVIPPAPEWTGVGPAPTAPVLGDVTLPGAPTNQVPLFPGLDTLTIPTFGGLTLPDFTAIEPEFEGTALPGMFNWTEPTYATEILDEVVVKIRELWNGKLGIPEAIEQAMFERAMSREDLIISREISAVADEFSLRGFTMPTGMQAARVDAIRQDGMIKKQGAQREMMIKIAEWQVENVRFAVTNAVAAENVYVNIFLNGAQRMFEAARFQVQAQLEVYNAQVALFNARQQAYATSAQVFDIRVRAELAKIEIFRAELEAELAKGQLNEQRVRVFQAQIQALGAEIEIYKARMQGASIESDVIRTRVETYKAQVQAYAERINADKVRFEAYEAQVRAEAAKAGIIDAEARAYAALIQGKSAQADIGIKRAEVTISTNRMLIEGFMAELDADKTRIQSQLSTIQAAAAAYSADTQRFAAQAQAATAEGQVLVAAHESTQRTRVAFYQTTMQAYVSNMERLIKQAALSLDAMKAVGELTATMAAGAMAGVHVGASLSGSGGVAASGAVSSSSANNNSTSNNTSTNYNYNYEGT